MRDIPLYGILCINLLTPACSLAYDLSLTFSPIAILYFRQSLDDMCFSVILQPNMASRMVECCHHQICLFYSDG